MKKLSLLGMAMIIALAFASCGSEKQMSSNNSKNNGGGKSPAFGDVMPTPCEIYDTETEFTATGIFKGSANQKGRVHQAALANAQDLVRQKIQHAYKGLVSNYMSTIGDNQGNDIEGSMSMAGDQVIMAVVNNTAESCVRWSDVGDDGHVECYVAIKISKAKLAENIANAVDNKLSDDAKIRIKFDELQYRKYMQEYFQNN